MMQPLKRFTQCGSLTMLFGVFIILFGVSSTALTTFGKSPSKEAPPTPIPMKGRECTTHQDCISISETSCVRDPNDYRMRCLCGDNKAPINGYCSTKFRGLKHKCKDLLECDDNMLCKPDNFTKTTLLSNTAHKDANVKVCLCDDETGYIEQDGQCNAAHNLIVGILSHFLAIGFYYVVTQKVLNF